jgi:DNA modification methylase
MIQLLKGDCLIESNKIESGSVDLILTDLPYGTVKGLGGDIEKYKRLSNSDWDNVIDTNKIMQIANRILRKNGKMILTANQPFTTELISKAIANLPHNYNMYWDKMHFANCLVANKAPVSYVEDVLVFSKMHDFEGLHPLRPYFKKVLDFINVKKVRIIEKTGQGADHCFRVNSSQFHLPTKETYNKLIEFYNINEMFDFRTFEDISKESDGMNSTFNLWEGNKYKSNILKYKKDYDGHHPTQKPILLLEDLIKTFSNENDLVVDLTMGSGSTLVACENTNRNGIGIEMNEDYFNIASERVGKKRKEKEIEAPTLFNELN